MAYLEPWSLNYWPLTALAPELGVTEINYVSLSSYTCKKTKQILVFSPKNELYALSAKRAMTCARSCYLMGSLPSGHVIELRIKLNRSKQIAKKGIKLNALINIEYCYIWLGILELSFKLVNGESLPPSETWVS